MRIALISDVHANLHALEAVLAEVDKGDFEELWFLGDLIGYGPRPNECTAILRERAFSSFSVFTAMKLAP